ncbi:bifunctional epoxide hydrolase 2 [Colletotrichum spaethianum]|uniref:Bifunctional epoxide hydrolase 2 n=1 Tax=Colletotrichum spaethianum TaxID=700344 RepID=A0AA37UNY8_9PEZI|nr:bifunctional epoxide hydrolase 2 [Colletotrichum spaethianum]GKT49560.1 bifunctional epoxide hydrolase 2 [Colletotrichum spaethianum]
MTAMDLSQLTKKTFNVLRGFTYTYYTFTSQNSKPTLFLFHGWPDSARLWTGFIHNYLIPRGYGVVALDNLGFGDSSKPTDPQSYALNHLTADVVEILEAEGLDSVVSVGHDWGSLIAQRLYNFYPKRVRALILVSVPYMVPTDHFDLDAINDMTKKMFGAGIFEYWYFFTADDAVDLMNQNVESVYSVVFGESDTWLKTWCAPGGMRKFITQGCTQPTISFATPEHKTDFMDRYRKGGFASSMCAYTVTSSGVRTESDRMLTDESITVRVPVFYWGGKQDYVCRPEMSQQAIAQGVLPDVQTALRTGGHWAFLETPAQFGQDILGWLQDKFE